MRSRRLVALVFRVEVLIVIVLQLFHVVDLFDKEGSAERIRAATSGNWQVTGGFGSDPSASGSYVLPFPASPHGDRKDVAASG